MVIKISKDVAVTGQNPDGQNPGGQNPGGQNRELVPPPPPHNILQFKFLKLAQRRGRGLWWAPTLLALIRVGGMHFNVEMYTIFCNFHLLKKQRKEEEEEAGVDGGLPPCLGKGAEA